MATAAYIAQADAFNKNVQWLVEIDLDRCAEDFGSAPCTATGADGAMCYYSYQTCQDIANYNLAVRTWRFCLNEVPWDDTASPAYPYLSKPVFTPQRIDPAKLFTLPEKVTVEAMFDWSPMAPDLDKTAHNTRTTGEFWRNLLARNRNYPGRPLRIKRGFHASGFLLSDFLQVGPEYKLKEIQLGKDGVKIVAESPLADLNKAVVPWAISNDNTIQDVGGITDADVTVNVLDGSEYPDPADYTRNNIYIRMENEHCKVTSIAANALTIVRAQNGTTAAAHAAEVEVEHIAIFGTDAGTSAATGRKAVDVCQDLMEWAGVVVGDVDTATFDHVADAELTALDTLRVVAKSGKISKHLQTLREIRGILIFIDSVGKWACKVMAPDEDAELYDEDRLLEGSVSVKEDEESRITRVKMFYDPNDENPGDDPKHYDRAVFVIDTDLEDANNFDGDKVRLLFDPWIDPALAVSKVRNVALRLITRLRAGVRTIPFQLDVKETAGLDVGGSISLQTRHILDITGAQEVRPCIITAKRDVALSKTEYEATDINYSGRYLRIGPATMAATYDTATAEDKSYGYHGDTNNRVGSLFEPGYIFW